MRHSVDLEQPDATALHIAFPLYLFEPYGKRFLTKGAQNTSAEFENVRRMSQKRHLAIANIFY